MCTAARASATLRGSLVWAWTCGETRALGECWRQSWLHSPLCQALLGVFCSRIISLGFQILCKVFSRRLALPKAFVGNAFQKGCSSVTRQQPIKLLKICQRTGGIFLGQAHAGCELDRLRFLRIDLAGRLCIATGLRKLSHGVLALGHAQIGSVVGGCMSQCGGELSLSLW